jgi:hypothetical protein
MVPVWFASTVAESTWIPSDATGAQFRRGDVMRMIRVVVAALLVVVFLAGCGDDVTDESSSATASSTTSDQSTTSSTVASTPTSRQSTTSSTGATTASSASREPIVSCTPTTFDAVVRAELDPDGAIPGSVEVAECQNGYARVYYRPDAPNYETEQLFLRAEDGGWMILTYGTGIDCATDTDLRPPELLDACRALGLRP